MFSGIRPWTAFFLILLPVGPLLAASCGFSAGETLVQLTHGDTGRRIACAVLKDGETVILTWTNSLFRLLVTETYVTKGGMLEQTGVVFADPGGEEPPRVRPEDVEDLYHTGGPFKAEGLSRPFSRIVFRVGEIGNPVLRIRDRSLQLTKEAGFGGAVILESSLPFSQEDTCR
jgi:hypothetical protein